MRALAVTVTALFALCAGALPADAGFPGTPGRIAFVQGDVGGFSPHGIATANPDGSDQRLAGPTCQEGTPAPCPGNPAASRDGSRIAFDVGGAIGTMRADGTEAKTFTVPGLIGLSRPAWDPSGNNLVFQAVDAQGKRNLYISGADGLSRRQLTFAGGAEPAWALDGRIAFVRNGNIYLIDADGKNLRRLTGKGGGKPNWSPYASQLTFVRSGNVHRVRKDGTGLRRLTGKSGFEPAWSPDGKRVLFHRNVSGNRTIYSVNLDAADLRTQARGEEGRVVNVFSVDQQPVR
ncbi:MAG: TolB family protein [Thermoleophilaceae bacterium]